MLLLPAAAGFLGVCGDDKHVRTSNQTSAFNMNLTHTFVKYNGALSETRIIYVFLLGLCVSTL